MEATKKRSALYEGARKVGQKAKAYAGKKATQAKAYGRAYGADIRAAYDVGYSRGWKDAYDIPWRFGCRTAAAVGYRKGLKQRKKSDRYTKQYQRKGN